MSGAFISFMLVIFVITLVLSVSKILKKQGAFIFTKTPSDPDKIEWAIRELIWKNPDAEIAVVALGKNPESNIILDRLANDFPQIHIIKNKN